MTEMKETSSIIRALNELERAIESLKKSHSEIKKLLWDEPKKETDL